MSDFIKEDGEDGVGGSVFKSDVDKDSLSVLSNLGKPFNTVGEIDLNIKSEIDIGIEFPEIVRGFFISLVYEDTESAKTLPTRLNGILSTIGGEVVDTAVMTDTVIVKAFIPEGLDNTVKFVDNFLKSQTRREIEISATVEAKENTLTAVIKDRSVLDKIAGEVSDRYENKAFINYEVGSNFLLLRAEDGQRLITVMQEVIKDKEDVSLIKFESGIGYKTLFELSNYKETKVPVNRFKS